VDGLPFLPPAFAEQSSSASERAEAFSAHHSEQRPFTFYTETGHSAYAFEQCTPAFEASASVFPAAPVDDLVWFLQVEQRMPTTTQQLLQRVAAIEPLVPVDHHMDQHYHLICSSHEATTATTSRVDSTTQLSTTPPDFNCDTSRTGAKEKRTATNADATIACRFPTADNARTNAGRANRSQQLILTAPRYS
jgi:hypothetical protein